MTTVVNLFGGPCCSKSTTAAGVFSSLKRRNVNAEYVSEYAKDLVWRNSVDYLREYNHYVSITQQERVDVLIGKVDVVITDSPSLLGLAYMSNPPKYFKEYILELWGRNANLNYFLERPKIYQTEGRNETKEEAGAVDGKIKKVLIDLGIDHNIIEVNEYVVERITGEVYDLFSSN